LIEKIPISQHLREGNQVNRLLRPPKIDKDIVNCPVCGDVKVFSADFLDAFGDCFAATVRLDHRSEHPLLCVHAVRQVLDFTG
jgi:hypothetical protein